MEIPSGVRIELAESGETIQTFRGWQATRIFMVNQADKIWLAPRIGEPFAVDMPYLQCVSVRRTPIKETIDGTILDTKYVKITADYSTRIPRKRVTERLNIGVRSLSTTKGKIWASDNKECSQTDTISYPVTEWILSAEQAAIPKALVFSLAGKINSSTYAGCPRGTLLFEGATTRNGTDEDGFDVYYTDYNFVYQENDWNLVWREESGTWDQFTVPNYQYGDFNLLGLEIE